MSKKSYLIKLLRLMFGQMLFGLSIYLILRANVGLSPWEAFHVGVQNYVPLSYGTIMNAVTVLLLIVAVLLEEPIGLGTLFSLFVVGIFVDVFIAIDFLPAIQNFALGLLVMIIAQFVCALGAYFYMSAGLGCGPRDALMTSIAKRIPKLPIGVIRGIIECSVLIFGYLLHAKVGIGTLISMFGVSVATQIVFSVLKFDVTIVHHEQLLCTLKSLCSHYTHTQKSLRHEHKRRK